MGQQNRGEGSVYRPSHTCTRHIYKICREELSVSKSRSLCTASNRSYMHERLGRWLSDRLRVYQ